ncbi:hypothetical protein ACPCK3_07430 [Streptomyces griseoincarnatus]
MTHTTHTAPLTLPDGLCSADASVTNPDCARSREFMWVTPDGQITMQAPADEDTAREHTEPAGLLTVAQQTLTYDEGLGAYRTARIETDMRDVDSISSDAENARTPLFSAEMVVADQAELWVGYGSTVGEVSPGKAREIAATMRAFADRLEALCDVADGISAADHQARG